MTASVKGNPKPVRQAKKDKTKEMMYLRKLWVRVVVSLIGGGIANEILFLSTGDPTRPRENGGSEITLIAAVVVFILLTILVSVLPPKHNQKLK